MFIARDGAAAERDRITRTRPDGSKASWRPYFGRTPGSATGGELEAIKTDPELNAILEPQVYLVEQPSEKIFQPHFHFVDQFQLVTAGEGSIGRHAVRPFSVHFASAFTGYGPITATQNGIDYLTIRARTEITGAHFLPDSKSDIRPGLKRNVIVNDIDLAELESKSRPADTVVVTYTSEPDGLAIMLTRVGSSMSATMALLVEGGGRCIVVLTGHVHCRGDVYGPLSVLFSSAGEGPLSLTADEAGANLLLLQFPRG